MRIPPFLVRGTVIWLAIIVAESIHGTLRELLLKPIVGDLQARQITFFTAIGLIFAITSFGIKWIRADGNRQLLAVGISWPFLTVFFEAFLVRPALNISWESYFSDHNILEGGMMGIGLIILALMPMAAAKFRGVLSGRSTV